MQGTWVRSLVQGDPTWQGTTMPMHHSWAWAPWSLRPTATEPKCPGVHAPHQEKPAQREGHTTTGEHPCSPLEKACTAQQRPTTEERNKPQNKRVTLGRLVVSPAFNPLRHQNSLALPYFRLRAGGEGDWDGWTASSTQQTQIWENPKR